MRATALAVVVLSVLVLSASHPTPAADRTVQTEATDAKPAPVVPWFGYWLDIVLRGTGVDPIDLTLALAIRTPDEQAEAKGFEEEFEEAGSTGVILEDGAPF